jgi:hypothetical protein
LETLVTEPPAVIEQKPWYRQSWTINVMLLLVVLGLIPMAVISRLTDWEVGVVVLLGFAPALLLDAAILIMMVCDTKWHRYRSRVVRITLDTNARITSPGSNVVDKATLTLENGDSLRLTNVNLQTLGSNRYVDYEHRVGWLIKVDNRNISFHSSPQD